MNLVALNVTRAMLLEYLLYTRQRFPNVFFTLKLISIICKDVAAISLQMDILISGTIAGKGWNIGHCLVVILNLISQEDSFSCSDTMFRNLI